MAKRRPSDRAPRGIILDPAKVRFHRLRKGFSSQEDLALAANLAINVVRKAESGKPIDGESFHLLLSKLDLQDEPERLMRVCDLDIAPPPASREKPRWRIRFTLEAEPPPGMTLDQAKEDPFAQRLFFMLKATGLLRDGVENDDIEFGSVIVSAEMTDADIMRIIKAFLQRELNSAGVTSISISEQAPTNYGAADSAQPALTFLVSTPAQAIEDEILRNLEASLHALPVTPTISVAVLRGLFTSAHQLLVHVPLQDALAKAAATSLARWLRAAILQSHAPPSAISLRVLISRPGGTIRAFANGVTDKAILEAIDEALRQYRGLAQTGGKQTLPLPARKERRH
jgi:hypothetical protein